MFKLLTAADAISLLNASFGLLAVISIFLQEQRLAFSFILLALLADGLDGTVARKWGGGKIGEYLEAMADMLSLSIAPLLFGLWFTLELYTVSNTLLILILSVGILFLICSAIRLASFHVLNNRQFFVGLPASVTTIFIVGLGILDVHFYVLLFALLLLSLAMVSSIPFPKPDIRMNLVASLLIIFSLVLYTSFSNASIILLLIALGLYSIAGPIFIIISREKTVKS